MKKNKILSTSNIITIIMIISVIMFIGIIMLLFNVFNNKKEEGPTYRKGGEQDNISRDGTKNYTDRMKTALNINSPEINAVINNPDIKGTTLGRLTAVVGDELSFNNGKFRIKESFRKSSIYVYKYFL